MKREALDRWVREIAAHTRPDAVHWCNGTEAEARALEVDLETDEQLVSLNAERYPHCFLYRSDPSDVARTEHLTFICTDHARDAGPTNNWMSPTEARERVWPLFRHSMNGRTMYVVPYLMGPEGSPYSRVGIELTDSRYVALNLRLMTRMGRVALKLLEATDDVVLGIHSLGDLSPDRRYICHFPKTRTIWSIGSGYGGNALLSKKCHALRLASVQAAEQGWLAEHMLIVGLTSPTGVTHYVAAAFPSACGKTNLAMLVPTLPGWRVETIGDDICWMHPGSDGRLWAINPEAGMFGVAPGTSMRSNPNAMRALHHDVIFTNVALRKDGTPWWEGMGEETGTQLTDWRRRSWNKDEGPAAHPNARFTAPLRNLPTLGPGFDDPRGVPISAILFGARRGDVVPLVYEAFNWEHGVYVGATMASETTAAATGAVGVLRSDPMAMLPFCGYNMADYFRHWLRLGTELRRPPRIFHVNWFRRGADGQFLWPGFGHNIIVLKWILDRLEDRLTAETTPIGFVPHEDDLEIGGDEVSLANLELLLDVDTEAWLDEARRGEDFLAKFGDALPIEIRHQHGALVERLRAAEGARRNSSR